MALEPFKVGTGLSVEPTTTSVTANTATTVDSFALSAADSVEFTVKVKQGSRYESLKALALHNGTTIDLVQYGEISIAATETVAGSGAVTWVTRTSNFGNTSVRSVAYGNNVWVAGGYNGQLRTSTDAITWTTRTSNFPTNTSGHIRSVAFGNNLWVAGGEYGNLRTSTDAITWTTRTSNFDTIILSVAYSNVWVAGGYNGSLRTSTDAITWTTQESNFGGTNIFSVAFGNNVWVAGGQSGQIRTSTDAVTWTTRTSNFGNTIIFDVAYGNSLWVAAGNTGQIRTSAATTASVTVPLTLSADISGADVRLRATITDAATTNAEVKVLKTTL